MNLLRLAGGVLLRLKIFAQQSMPSVQQRQSPFETVPEASSDVLKFDVPLGAFKARDLSGQMWHSRDLRGKTTVIDIWATYCAPCRAEHPELQRFYERVRTGGTIQVLTFSMDEDPSQAAAYVKNQRYSFLVIANANLVQKLFPPAEGIPQHWIISPEGRRSAPFRSWTLGRILFEIERSVAPK